MPEVFVWCCHMCGLGPLSPNTDVFCPNCSHFRCRDCMLSGIRRCLGPEAMAIRSDGESDTASVITSSAGSSVNVSRQSSNVSSSSSSDHAYREVMEALRDLTGRRVAVLNTGSRLADPLSTPRYEAELMPRSTGGPSDCNSTEKLNHQSTMLEPFSESDLTAGGNSRICTGSPHTAVTGPISGNSTGGRSNIPFNASKPVTYPIRNGPLPEISDSSTGEVRDRSEQPTDQSKDSNMESIKCGLCQMIISQISELEAHMISHQLTRQTKQTSDLEERDETDHRFLPLPFSHPKSAAWRRIIFPWIKANYRNILGPDNIGSIEMLSDRGAPTVCVTARFPELVSHALLRGLTAIMDVSLLVGKGEIHRSVCDISCWPTINGQYAVRPNCGASLGVSECPLEKNRVSLGGYVKLLFSGQHDWESYGLTCHHLLDGGNQNDLVTKGIEQDARVVDARSDARGESLHEASPNALEIQSPHQVDFDNALSRLRERRDMCKRDKDYAKLDVLPVDQIALLEAADLQFGHVYCSSGLCIHDRLQMQMDWLLIEGISSTRTGLNSVGDASDFMEVPSVASCSPSTDFVTYELFDALIRSCSGLATLAPGQVGGLSRIHGRGCESGLKDGYLSSNQVCVILEGMDASSEWAFTPRDRNGLGISGDSGAWIFLENTNHHALGQIWGHNPFTNTTFYTPLYVIFDHIKEITGALDVRLPLEDDYRCLTRDHHSYHVGQTSSGENAPGTPLEEQLPETPDVHTPTKPDIYQLHQVDSGYSSSQTSHDLPELSREDYETY